MAEKERDMLAGRLEDFDRRVRSIADSDRLSPNAQMQALALLVSLNAPLFGKCANALRASSPQEGNEG